MNGKGVRDERGPHLEQLGSRAVLKLRLLPQRALLQRNEFDVEQHVHAREELDEGVSSKLGAVRTHHELRGAPLHKTPLRSARRSARRGSICSHSYCSVAPRARSTRARTRNVRLRDIITDLPGTHRLKANQSSQQLQTLDLIYSRLCLASKLLPEMPGSKSIVCVT